jgi:hypothetical protein
MVELRLKYDGGGRFYCTDPYSFSAAEAAYAPGVVVRAQTSEPKSKEQNGYLHAIIGEAWENQSHNTLAPMLPSPEHLKAHILIAVGHEQQTMLPPGAITKEAAQLLRGRPKAPLIEWTQRQGSGHITMHEALTTKGLSMDEMSALIDKVVHYICEKVIPGTTPEDWSPKRFGIKPDRAGTSPETRGR